MEYNISNAPISNLTIYDTKKDGSPLISKKGDPYKKVSFRIDPDFIDDMEFEGYVSMLDFNNTSNDWKEGTVVTGVVTKSGDFWNFSLPRTSLGSKVDSLARDVQDLKARVDILEGNPAESHVEAKTVVDMDDVPF